MTEIKIKLRVLRKWLTEQAQTLWCRVNGHYWDVTEQGVVCSRCGKPGW